MPQINVLHLMNNFQDSSISRIVLRLVENMDLKDICWHIGAIDAIGSTRDLFTQLGVQTVVFSRNNQNGRLSVIPQIRDYIKEKDIRIIHTHTPRTIFTASRCLFGMPGMKHLATKHLLNEPFDRKWGVIFSIMDRFSLYLPDRLIPVSSTMYQQIISQPGIQKERVLAIRNAIPFEQFYVPDQRESCRKELGISLDSVVLGYTGRLKKVKRIDLLLNSFSIINKTYPNTHLIIAGDGELRPYLESYAVSLGLSNQITWVGFRQDIPRILAAIDIYIQTSVNEGLSLSLLEAMASGKPVIATNVGGNAEIIKNEITGLLIKEAEVSEIVNALTYLIEHPDVRNQFSNAGLDLIRNEFSLNSMVAGYKNLYLSVLAENGMGVKQ